MEISGTTKVVGVFGHPIEHTLSPAMHNAAFDHLSLDIVYAAFRVEPADIGDAVGAIRALGLLGANITIPHKVAVVPFLDEVDPAAEYLGNVNTIVNDGGKLIGHNTDGPGIIDALRTADADPAGKRVLCVGAGGVAQTVVLQLAKAGAVDIDIVNRTADRGMELATLAAGKAKGPSGSECCFRYVPFAKGEDFHPQYYEAVASADIIVQTTSVGMYPKADMAAPVPVNLLGSRHTVFELVYNPLRTRLVQEAEARRCKVVDGSVLFLYQGALAFKLWTGTEAPLDIMSAVLREKLSDKLSMNR